MSELKSLGHTVSRDTDVHGLLLPLHTVEGQPGTAYLLKEDRSVPLVVYRPDTTTTGPDGRTRKYLYPTDQPQRLDCPPRCQPLLNNPAVTLWVTEGQRKADALASHDLCALDVLGAWNWRILGDWQHVRLAGRDIRLVYDSDWLTKKDVKSALYALKTFLTSQGARVSIISLPSPDGRKVGVDDFLLTHTLTDLEQLCHAPHGGQAPLPTGKPLVIDMETVRTRPLSGNGTPTSPSAKSVSSTAILAWAKLSLRPNWPPMSAEAFPCPTRKGR